MVSTRKEFVHLHVHTDYSLLDGCARIDRLMKRASELGQPAIAMTDHGNLFGAIEFVTKAKKFGVKPLIGCEIYLVHDHLMSEKPPRARKRSDDIDDVPDGQALQPADFPNHQIHHKTLIAKNFKGYQNLVQLISDAHINGMYYRPRTDMEQLARYSEGIIALSGCINGVASQYLIYNDYAKAREATATFVDIFGRENYFVEIQNHGISAQQRIIPGLLKLAREFDLKVVCANDVHYVLRDDWEPHDALLCIQTGRVLADEQRMRYPCNEFYLKSREEMERVFHEVPESLDNTLDVAEMVDLEIRFGENHYPRFEKPLEITYREDPDSLDKILDIYVVEKNKVNHQNGIEEEFSLSSEERLTFRENGLFLFDLCKKGLKFRYGVDYDDPDSYSPKEGQHADYARKLCEKLDYELAIIIGTGFIDYFLIVWDFIAWARDHDIPVGPGRGSGAGCLVAYVLRITDIEPLRFGLLFERMLNLERVSPPDFDVDFCMRRRDEVVNFVREKYGADHVANIITYGTFGAKMIVRDLARVNSVEYAQADRLAKMVPDELNISLEDAVEKSMELKQELKGNEVARKIINHGKVIEGMVRNTGKHACGIIIGDQRLTNLVPVTLQEGDPTTQYAKGPVEKLGLLKMDFLGLKTLTVISDAQENVRFSLNQPDFDIEQIPLHDEKTFELLNSGRTTGVFQLESGGMQSLCRQIGLSAFEEIIALIALYRPGPMQFIPQFIKGKNDPSTIEVPHPLLKDLVSETYGVLVYQEQVMESARIIAGYTLGGADILRRAMGKKIAKVMAQQREVFVKGAKETHNIDRKTALEIFAILEKFAEYGFNKSHSAAYAMLSYRTAYLKANFPVQFMAAVLSSELGNSDKVAHFIDECKAFGIPVLGPNVNSSRENFTPILDERPADQEDTNETFSGSIRFGLGAIKGVGDGAAKTIIEEREANGPYTGCLDLINRVDSRAVNKRVLEALIKSGAFDALNEERGELLHNLDALIKEQAARQRDRERGQASFLDMFDMDPAPAPASNLMGGNGANGSGIEPMTRDDKLKFERELLGFYVSGHPLERFAGLAEGLSSFRNAEYSDWEDRTPYRLCGVISGISKKLTRKNNRPWAILQVLTKSSSYQINMYAEAYEKNMDLLEEGKIFLVTGSVNKRNGEAVLTADSVRVFANVLHQELKQLTWVLNPGPGADEFLQLLREELEPHYGETRVAVAFKIKGDYLIKASIASSLSWFFDIGRFRKLRKHKSVLGVIAEGSVLVKEEPAWMRRQKNGN